MSKIIRRIIRHILLTPRIHKFYDQFSPERAFDHRLQRRFIADRIKAEEAPDFVDFDEAFTDGDAKAVRMLVEHIARDNMTVVEVGSWKGKSTSVLAETIQKHNGKVFAVDHWEGDEGTWNKPVAETYDIFAIFRRNMRLLGLEDIVHPLVMASEVAFSLFADESLDLIFLDGDHKYKGFKQDLENWLPKLKKGGIICGHDCEGKYSNYPEEIKRAIDANLDKVTIDGIHPGVVKALHEQFNDNHIKMPNSRIWFHQRSDRYETLLSR